MSSELNRNSGEFQTLINLGYIPSKGVLKCSKGQKIEKLCGRTEWQPRILYVTGKKLLIVHPDQENQVSDQIPLVMRCCCLTRDENLTCVFSFSTRSRRQIVLMTALENN